MILEIFASNILTAVVAAWVTVQLSLRKFRVERLWEKRAESYERVIKAFHDLSRFFHEHLEADRIEQQRGKRMTVEKSNDLTKQAENARKEINRARDVGSFLLSHSALKILADYNTKSKSLRHESWFDDLIDNLALIDEYSEAFISEARICLKIEKCSEKLKRILTALKRK